jgi:hypothetical protein
VFIFDTDIYTNVMRKIPSETLLNRLKKATKTRSIHHNDYHRGNLLWINESLKHNKIA